MSKEKQKKRIIVCGSRYWKDVDTIKNVLVAYKDCILITGGCKGADVIADTIGKKLNMETIVVEADWKSYGLAAGPMRNNVMANMKPHLVFGFHEDIAKSKGTKNMRSICKKKNIEFVLITNDDN